MNIQVCSEAAMKEITTTVTQRGQVTIPAEVRRALGLKPKDKVTFQLDGTEVRLAAASFTLESAFGSVTPSTRPEDIDAIIEAAKADKIDKEIRQLNRA